MHAHHNACQLTLYNLTQVSLLVSERAMDVLQTWEKKGEMKTPYTFTRGAVGVYLSHVECYRQLLLSGVPSFFFMCVGRQTSV